MAALRRTMHTQQKVYDAIQQEDFRIQGIRRDMKAQNLVRIGHAGEDRIVYKRNARAWAQEEAERLAVQKREQELTRRQNLRETAAREDALADALARMRDEELGREKRRQMLHDEPELRELRRQLEAAHVSKGVRNQVVANEESRKTDTMTRRLEAEQSLAMSQRLHDEELEATARKMEHAAAYSKDLDAQLHELEEAKLHELALKTKEAEQIDRIIQLVREEDDVRGRVAAERKLAQLQQENEFLIERDQYRAVAAEEERKQEAVAAEQARLLEERSASEKAVKAQQFAALEALQEQLAATIREKQENDDQIAAIIEELYQEEMLEKLLREQEAEEQKRATIRAEMQAEHESYLRSKADMKARLEQEDREFRVAMMEKFAREDRLEQMSAQKRRMTAVAHGREVAKMMEERKARKIHEAKKRMEEHKRELEMQQARRDAIEEERQRILAEYTAREDLVGHIPKGVIQEGDVGVLPDTMKVAYTRRQRDEDYF